MHGDHSRAHLSPSLHAQPHNTPWRPEAWARMAHGLKEHQRFPFCCSAQLLEALCSSSLGPLVLRAAFSQQQSQSHLLRCSTGQISQASHSHLADSAAGVLAFVHQGKEDRLKQLPFLKHWVLHQLQKSNMTISTDTAILTTHHV